MTALLSCVYGWSVVSNGGHVNKIKIIGFGIRSSRIGFYRIRTFATVATANSGETFNIVSSIDLNRDGVFSGVTNSDRPVGIAQNAGTTPPQYNVDLRWTRFISISERYKVDVFAEFQNLFNINCIVQYNNVLVDTNPVTGEWIGRLPDFKARNNSTYQESRQVQIDIRFSF